jgi:membrane protein
LLESPPPSGLSAVAPAGSFLGRLLETLDRSNIPLLASALTFDALLALIPFAVLLIAGLGLLLDRTDYFGMLDPGALIANFVPTGSGTGTGPSALVAELLEKVRNFRSSFTWIAIPAFLWFSTRMFSAIRVCLSNVFHVRARPMPGGYVVSYLIGYVVGKGQDLLIVLVVLTLALVNTLLSGTIALLTGQGIYLEPPWTFLVSGLGMILGEVVAFASGVALFVALYRYASPRRLSWRGSLLAAAVSTVGFELAKRLFGLYLAHSARGGQFALDVNLGAALLLLLWIWYMALVFLIGAAVAHVWEGRRGANSEQRAA